MFSDDSDAVFYSEAQISSLFDNAASVTVINPNPPDIVAPVVGAGTILTPEVSLTSAAPYAAVKISVGDRLSGVVNANVSLSGPPGAGGSPSQMFLFAQLSAPLNSGGLVLSSLLPPSQTLGTYTVTSISLSDGAGNYDFVPTSSIAWHFKTFTINVTK